MERSIFFRKLFKYIKFYLREVAKFKKKHLVQANDYKFRSNSF